MNSKSILKGRKVRISVSVIFLPVKQSVLSGGAQLPQLPEIWTLFESVSVEHHAVLLPAVVQAE